MSISVFCTFDVERRAEDSLSELFLLCFLDPDLPACPGAIVPGSLLTGPT